jgi:hypothetical protein
MENDFVRAVLPSGGTEEPTGAALSRDDFERTGDAIAVVDSLLDSVEQALARLDEGTYGTCDSCGQAIDDAHLEVAPTRLTCESCSSGPSQFKAEGADVADGSWEKSSSLGAQTSADWPE